jgi:hypothetical protein
MMASAATALKREVSSLASTQASDIAICILMLARDEQVKQLSFGSPRNLL